MKTDSALSLLSLEKPAISVAGLLNRNEPTGPRKRDKANQDQRISSVRAWSTLMASIEPGWQSRRPIDETAPAERNDRPRMRSVSPRVVQDGLPMDSVGQTAGDPNRWAGRKTRDLSRGRIRPGAFARIAAVFNGRRHKSLRHATSFLIREVTVVRFPTAGAATSLDAWPLAMTEPRAFCFLKITV